MEDPYFVSGISFEEFFRIVDDMYDELLIYDNNYNIVYINKACIRHYGCDPDKMIGKSFYDFVYADWWGPSILPIVYQEKKAHAIKQVTFLGAELLTIAVPVFDEKNEIKYVVMNVRDSINEIDLYNPEPISYNELVSAVIVPVAESPESKKIMHYIDRLSVADSSCIIWGEAGTGKTTIARYLHSLSKRRSHQFAVMDCSLVPDDKLARELFGSDNLPGLLYRVRNGTILLKNITRLHLEAQARLVQYLTGEINFPFENKARILVSSEKNLKEEVAKGRFYPELYYTLSSGEIYVPPLRARRQDINALIQSFWGEFCAKHQTNHILTEGAREILMRANWPGNIRELKHIVERIIVMSDTLVIDIEQLPKSLFGISAIENPFEAVNENKSFDQRVEDFESALIHDAYQKFGTSRKIAKELGISQTRANNLIRKYIKGETNRQS